MFRCQQLYLIIAKYFFTYKWLVVAKTKLVCYNKVTLYRRSEKMNLGSNIKILRKEKGLTQEKMSEILNNSFPDTVNFNKGKISKWENGKETPYLSSAKVLADFFETTVDDLINSNFTSSIYTIYNQLEPPRQQKVYSLAENELEEQRYIQDHDDYVGQTAAGEPIEGQQPIPMIGSETVNLLVNGDSMEPQFYNGDIVQYHPQPELENGEIGVFAVNGGVTLKRFRKNDDIRLESLNKKYEDIVIQETDEFSILGKVII